MPLRLSLDKPTEPLSLEGFIEAMEPLCGSLESQEGLAQAAEPLLGLSLNKSFLAEFLCNELQDEERFQQANLYGPQVVILYSSPAYFLRANIWKPMSDLEKKIEGFVYDICHDHNFNILTVGYHGPGYSSRTYAYDYDKCQGYVGEFVDLKPTGTVVLAEGEVFLYREKKDVHIQLPPEQLSVSLNVIPKTNAITQPQFQFHEKEQRIVRYIHSSSSEIMLRLADVMGISGEEECLLKLTEEERGPLVRALALKNLLKTPRGRAFFHLYRHDWSKDSLVAELLQKEVERSGSTIF